MNLKPKRELTYVPGVGVVKREDFTKEHLKKCTEYVKAHNVDVENYLKTRFEVASYSDLELFEGNDAVKEKPSAQLSKKEKAALEKAEKEKKEAADKALEEEAKILAAIEEEEKEKNTAK